MESVRRGLDAVPEEADIVVVHDAAHPLASRALFESVIEALTDGVDCACRAFRRPSPSSVSKMEWLSPLFRATISDVNPHHPTSSWIWGCAAARGRALDALVRDPEPGIVFDSMCSIGAVAGVTLSESFVDIGTHEALREYLQRMEP